MTRQDIEILQHAIEASPNNWQYRGADAEEWSLRGQQAQDEEQKDTAYLIAGTLQLLNGIDSSSTIQRTPAHEARLTASKPTQHELDMTTQTLRWLSGHAQLFPEEYATIGDPTATEAVNKLVWAANASHVHRDDLITTSADLVRRDVQNALMNSTDENGA